MARPGAKNLRVSHTPTTYDTGHLMVDPEPGYQGRVTPDQSLTREWEEAQRAAQHPDEAPVLEVRKTAKKALRVLEVPEAFWGPKPLELRFEFEPGFYVAGVRYGTNNIKHFGGRIVDMTVVTFNVYGPDGVLREEKRQAPRHMFERLRVRTDFLPDPSVAATDPTPELAVQASTVEEPEVVEKPEEEETLASRNARYLTVPPLPEDHEKLFGRNLSAYFHGWKYTSRQLPSQTDGLLGTFEYKGMIYEVRRSGSGFFVRRETFPNERALDWSGTPKVRQLTPDLKHYPENHQFDSIYEAVAAAQAKMDVLKHEGFLLSHPGPWRERQAIGDLYVKPNAMTGVNAEPEFAIMWMGQNDRGEDLFSATDPGNIYNLGPETDLEVLFAKCRSRLGVVSNPDLPLRPKFTWEWPGTIPNRASNLEYNQGGIAGEMTLPDGQTAYKVIALARSIEKRFVVRAVHPLLRGRWGADRTCEYLREKDPWNPEKETAREICEQAIRTNWFRLTGR